jgi:biotin transport system substrate-specific component
MDGDGLGSHGTAGGDPPGTKDVPVQRGRLPARDLALVAVFAALIAALGMLGTLTPFGNAAPITAQTLGVMLAGSVLGARRGALAVLTFLVLVAAGLPLLAVSAVRPQGGIAAFTAVSGGFLVGWLPGAWVTGRLVELRPRRFTTGWLALANVVGGILAVYVVGIPVMAAVGGMSLWQATVVSAIYLPGDAIKVAVSAVVTAGVLRGYPSGVVPARRHTDRTTSAAGRDRGER